MFDILPPPESYPTGSLVQTKDGRVWENVFVGEPENWVWKLRASNLEKKSTKPQLSRLTVFKDALSDVAEVLTHGEQKYNNDKAYLTYDKQLDIDAALRHIMQYKGNDDETGKLHVIHAICRLLFFYNKAMDIE